MTIPIKVLEIGLQIYKSTQTYTGIDLQALQKFCRVFFLQIINFG